LTHCQGSFFFSVYFVLLGDVLRRGVTCGARSLRAKWYFKG
jgi:hypothetical protein